MPTPTNSLANTKKLLNQHLIKPNKRLGQNFLVTPKPLDQLMDAAQISPKDTVLEVGPGIGAITVTIIEIASRVIAVEKDPTLIPILKENAKGLGNLEIVLDDILKLDVVKLGLKDCDYKLVGNIPYYLTAPLIRKFLESPHPPSGIILMIQKEMAQRICAKPPHMSILAVSVQVYARPEIIAYVPSSSFWPKPKVDSAIIRIKISSSLSGKQESRIKNDEESKNKFFKIVKAGFASPRKQLANNLSRGLGMERERVENWMLKHNIDPTRRAETLSVEEWLSLANSN